MTPSTLPVVIIGAGPVGLAAAAHALDEWRPPCPNKSLRPVEPSAVFLDERERRARPIEENVIMNVYEAGTAVRQGLRSQKAKSTGCCGGPAPAGTNACCAQDAAVKTAGGSGCGCGSPAVAPTGPKTACCG